MIDSITIKPKTFVKDLPCKDKVTPEYLEALDSFLYGWIESMLPYYEEFRSREADVFECENVTTFGKDWAECYTKGGIHYRFSETPLWGRTLSLDGGAGYTELNWRRCFVAKYPEFGGSKTEHFMDEVYLNWYFHRYHKKEPKYCIVADRARDYFREITGDPEIILDIGYKSFIYKDPKIRDIINWYPEFYY